MKLFSRCLKGVLCKILQANFVGHLLYEVGCITAEVSILRRGRETSNGGPMSTDEKNMQIVRRVIEQGVNAQDLSVFDELISSFVDHEAEGSEPGGAEGENELLSSIRESFLDWRWDIQEMLAAEDKVITRYVVHGTR
jgi:predicted ester cyclase